MCTLLVLLTIIGPHQLITTGRVRRMMMVIPELISKIPHLGLCRLFIVAIHSKIARSEVVLQ